MPRIYIPDISAKENQISITGDNARYLVSVLRCKKGVKEIMPVITERSQAKETRKVSRWRKIAEEASRQSGRTFIPTIHEPVEFNQFFGNVGKLKGSGETVKRGHGEMIGIIFWEEGGLSLKEAVHKFSDSPIPPFPPSPIQV